MKKIKMAGLFLAALALSGCNDEETETVYVEDTIVLPEPIPGPPPIEEFRNMVYVSTGRAEYYDNIRENLSANVEAITDVNLSFANPTDDASGELKPLSDEQIEDINYIQDLFEREHPDARMYIAFGGWRYDTSFDPVYESIARNDEARTAFIENILALVHEYGFDGVDMDWEYPRVEYADEYALFIRELGNALHVQGKYLSAAVIGKESKPNDNGNGAAYLDSTFEDFDNVNLMAYDMDYEDHSNYEHAVESIDYWVHERGLDPKKTLLGLPAYSRPGWQDFNKIVRVAEEGGSPEGHPKNACVDTFMHEGETNYYNGLPTIQAKVQLAMDQSLGGVMLWEAPTDSADPKFSIVKTVDNYVNKNGELNYCEENLLP